MTRRAKSEQLDWFKDPDDHKIAVDPAFRSYAEARKYMLCVATPTAFRSLDRPNRARIRHAPTSHTPVHPSSAAAMGYGNEEV